MSGLTVDALAQEIRRVDGAHMLGAGALAEALMPFLAATPASDEAVGDATLAVFQVALDAYWANESLWSLCGTCKGTGYEMIGNDPEWCGTCGGQKDVCAGTEAEAYRAALTAALSARTAAPAEQGDATLVEAYQAGWVNCTRWAGRDDLISDIDSPAYQREQAAAIARLAPIAPDARSVEPRNG